MIYRWYENANYMCSVLEAQSKYNVKSYAIWLLYDHNLIQYKIWMLYNFYKEADMSARTTVYMLYPCICTIHVNLIM